MPRDRNRRTGVLNQRSLSGKLQRSGSPLRVGMAGVDRDRIPAVAGRDNADGDEVGILAEEVDRWLVDHGRSPSWLLVVWWVIPNSEATSSKMWAAARSMSSACRALTACGMPASTAARWRAFSLKCSAHDWYSGAVAASSFHTLAAGSRRVRVGEV